MSEHETMTLAEYLECSHCGGSGDDEDAMNDANALSTKCSACAGSGDGRKQTIW